MLALNDVRDIETQPFIPACTINKSELSDWLRLRADLVLTHPLLSKLVGNPAELFKVFELYSQFVCSFTEYVSKLFISLSDESMKRVVYDNLTDEIGIGSQHENMWKAHHGELYLQFISSLRKLPAYRLYGIDRQTDTLQAKSKEIALRFYSAHADIISDGNDLQSFSAFSTIECWVSELYERWKNALLAVEGYGHLDMRTIDLHAVCDVQHSATLDELIMSRSATDREAEY